MADSKALVWDETGKKTYETGVKKGVLYVQNDDGSYPKGVAWNGLTKVSEKPTGAEATDLYADDTKYLSLISAEKLEASVEAYTYPKEFEQCDGSAEIAPGITIGQQDRKSFGLVYVTTYGNDIQGNSYGYKIHIMYGAKAQPSERGYSTINDSPEAITFTWEIKTTPVNVTGHKPTALITIDSKTVDAEALAKLEKVLFGDDTTEPHLPTPDEIVALMAAS